MWCSGNIPSFQVGVTGSIPVIRFLNSEVIMSLISQADRQLALEAIDFYLFNKQYDFNEDKRMQLNALANWIRLESFKHEN